MEIAHKNRQQAEMAGHTRATWAVEDGMSGTVNSSKSARVVLEEYRVHPPNALLHLHATEVRCFPAGGGHLKSRGSLSWLTIHGWLTQRYKHGEKELLT